MKEFLRDEKKPQTNADRIRNMTDEELPEIICLRRGMKKGEAIVAWDGEIIARNKRTNAESVAVLSDM